MSENNSNNHYFGYSKKHKELLLELYRKFFDLLNLKITDEECYYYDPIVKEMKTEILPVLTNYLHGAWYDEKEIIDLFIKIKELEK